PDTLTRPRSPPLRAFPYTTLFRSDPPRDVAVGMKSRCARRECVVRVRDRLGDLVLDTHLLGGAARLLRVLGRHKRDGLPPVAHRSEEHTSELQSPYELVCCLRLEK